jgi:hypothetical protein
MWQSHAPPVSKSLPVPAKKRIWTGKETCKPLEQAENHKKSAKRLTLVVGWKPIWEIPIKK